MLKLFYYKTYVIGVKHDNASSSLFKNALLLFSRHYLGIVKNGAIIKKIPFKQQNTRTKGRLLENVKLYFFLLPYDLDENDFMKERTQSFIENKIDINENFDTIISDPDLFEIFTESFFKSEQENVFFKPLQ